MTIWHMRIACWIHKARNTRSEYVIIIISLSLQQWFVQTRLKVNVERALPGDATYIFRRLIQLHVSATISSRHQNIHKRNLKKMQFIV